MEEAFNKNTAAFSAGIQMLEVQNAVLRRVIDHLAPGNGNHLAHRDDLGRIDWNGYLKELLQELADREEAKEKGPLVASPDEDETIYFGGSP